MKTLWAPWRIEYILGPKPDECIFCIPEHNKEDEERMILYRGKYSFVIMNKYPYNNGHIMVTPYKHVSTLTELTPNQSHEVMDLLQESSRILQTLFTPDGLNIGLNIGDAAGAGIEEHLHFHLVPRWSGDHSFMAVFGDCMVVPEHIQSTYNRLKPYFQELK